MAGIFSPTFAFFFGGSLSKRYLTLHSCATTHYDVCWTMVTTCALQMYPFKCAKMKNVLLTLNGRQLRGNLRGLLAGRLLNHDWKYNV